MRSAKVLALLLISTICTPVLADQPRQAQGLPTIKRIEHQRMTIGDRVVYEADVNVLDPDAKRYWIEGGIDERPFRVTAVDRSVGYIGNQRTGARESDAEVWMVSYVVQEENVAGLAQLDLIYTIRDPVKGINRTEHLRADVQVGKRFSTTSPDGAKVWLLVTYQ